MPKYLEMTADKFTFRVATDRLYSPEGVWILPQPDSTCVRVGLADYGLGHCSVIVMAGTFTEVVQRFLNWNEQSKGVTVLKCVCGVLVLLGGVWLIYSAP